MKAWVLMLEAAAEEASLWQVPAFHLDFVDVTRQVMSNGFIELYSDFVHAYNTTMSARPTYHNSSLHQALNTVSQKGEKLLDFITAIDLVLSTDRHFTLDNWLTAAQFWANITGSEDLISFNARSQVTVWQIGAPSLNDYASKAWSGLTLTYYRERWAIFVDALKKAVLTGSLNGTAMNNDIMAFENSWQYQGFGGSVPAADLKDIVEKIQREWTVVFSVED